MPTIEQIIALVIVLVGTIILFSISWPNIRGAPWVPTRMKKVQKMLTLANIQPGELIYDLGCGDGRIIVMAARKFNARAVGIEIDLFRYLWCQFLITVLCLRRKVKVVYGDFFKKNISDANVVFCYLLQSTNDRLEEKLIKELQPNTRVISNTFMFHGLPLDETEGISGIYVYRIDDRIVGHL
ncbi:MAG: SAM-dependent methyltransferase [Candidatus Heimdallarchaeota archaeon]|nr:SAM-dependent methyltransferase [Candidatus Heimdallarchaeota archaeon]